MWKGLNLLFTSHLILYKDSIKTCKVRLKVRTFVTSGAAGQKTFEILHA